MEEDGESGRRETSRINRSLRLARRVFPTLPLSPRSVHPALLLLSSSSSSRSPIDCSPRPCNSFAKFLFFSFFIFFSLSLQRFVTIVHDHRSVKELVFSFTARSPTGTKKKRKKSVVPQVRLASGRSVSLTLSPPVPRRDASRRPRVAAALPASLRDAGAFYADADADAAPVARSRRSLGPGVSRSGTGS